MQKPIIVVPIVIVVLVLAFLTYDFFKKPTCEEIFKQTDLNLKGNLELIETKGDFFLGKEKIQDLTERSQMTALTLKACCIAVGTGKIKDDQFLECKNTVGTYKHQIEKVVTIVKAAQEAKVKGQPALVEKKARKVEAILQDTETTVRDLAAIAEGVTSQSPESSGESQSSAKFVDPNPRADPPPVLSSGGEREPNNKFSEATPASFGSTVSAEITGKEDQDYFKFHNPLQVRDRVKVKFSNLSMSLAPLVDVHDYQKAYKFRKYNETSGADLEFSFVAEPGKDYYLKVPFFGSGGGKYKLSVAPQSDFDRYEPNDTVQSATQVTFGKTVTANILDKADVDWYKVAEVPGKNIRVAFQNLSPNLAPLVDVHDYQKAYKFRKYNETSGADLEFSFETEVGKDFYLRVPFFGNGGGEYRLMVDRAGN